jgi:hypothetical protein
MQNAVACTLWSDGDLIMEGTMNGGSSQPGTGIRHLLGLDLLRGLGGAAEGQAGEVCREGKNEN